MSDLADIQAEMATALMSGCFEAVAHWVQPGPLMAEEALAVHRNTALHGLVNALRLGHPTVDALVGEDFFDQAAQGFMQAEPPSSTWLTGYGAGFAAFLKDYEPARDLPYLADVARFDFAIEAVGGQALGLDGQSLDLGEAVLTLDGSLRLIALSYPAAAIRDAITEDEARLASLDMQPRRYVTALWRLPDGVGLRALGPLSAAFLQAIVEGRDPSGLLTEDADLEALTAEVFTAPFARITPKTA